MKPSICLIRMAVLWLAWAGSGVRGAEPGAFLTFIRQQAEQLRADALPPQTEAEWQSRRTVLRRQLVETWGGFPTPAEACPLEPRKLGELKRDGYRVEKIVLQTRPGILAMTNAYVPDKPGRLPTVLCVHGHWAGAKQDPVVQARCIGLVKLGFFVLSIDAFGAGERGITKNLGQYHGEMSGATLLPTGQPLSGLQVYDNQRAVDYLLTRPEVDPARIGITGASGGGNQTMYAGTFDERLKAIVPVCSVGNYHAYLGAACCMCEVVPGALRFTDEGELFGLAAERSVMVISATKDAPQFSVAEARKTIDFAAPIFALKGRGEHLRQTIIESPHHYNEPMRQAMYGWMTKHLKGEGDGSPIPEPAHQTEGPEALRCFPGDSRPDDFVTLPQYAAAEARRLLAKRTAPESLEAAQADRTVRLKALATSLGGSCSPSPPAPLPGVPGRGEKELNGDGTQTLTFMSEPGIELRVYATAPGPVGQKTVVLLDLDQPAEQTLLGELASALRTAGTRVVVPELRAVGRLSVPGDKIGGAPDHNSAEWSLWIGRPLIGQWTLDVRRALDVVLADVKTGDSKSAANSDITLIGTGPAGLVALTAGALDARFTRVATIGTLASFVTAEPYKGQRLGTLIPGVLRDVGDVADIAALIAPRKLVIAGGVSSGGQTLSVEQLRAAYSRTLATGAWHSSDCVSMTDRSRPTDLAAWLKAAETR